MNFGVTAGDPWPAGGVVDVKSLSIIEFSGPNKSKIETYYDISVIFFFNIDVKRAAGDPWPVDGKSNVIIEISGPNNPKIDAQNDISAIYFNSVVTAGGG